MEGGGGEKQRLLHDNETLSVKVFYLNIKCVITLILLPNAYVFNYL